MIRQLLRATGPLLPAVAAVARAQGPVPSAPDSVRRLDSVRVTARRAEAARVPALQRLTLPTTASVTAARVRQTVNVVDVPDAVKYLPSVFLRKRNYGDTQATMATRTWGVSSSARSLIFADGVPLTALVANNNTIGGPRWGLVSPEEIARVDMMYGPFSAAYGGSSMGAVMEITTRLPDRPEAGITQTQALQRFDQYGTRATYGTAQTNAYAGTRAGRLAVWASGNYQDSRSQPLSYVTSAAFPNGTTGGYAEANRFGQPANVIGAGGLLHTRMTNAKVKLAYDITPTLRASYTGALWRNDASAAVESYLARTAPATGAPAAAPTYAGQAAFASNNYELDQRHSAHSLVVRSDTRRDWDVELVGTRYRFDRDRQRTPVAASAADASFAPTGRIADLAGTGWWTGDVKGAWHRGGPGARHTVSFGAHGDEYRLTNPTYATTDWRAGDPGAVVTSGAGRTRTQALWAQDRWLVSPSVQFTLGGRYEWWRAVDGVNVNGAARVEQPSARLARFSPKAILAWNATPTWTLSASAGKAYRFATVSELYQLVSTGTTFTAPAPDLRPDDVLATELRAERRTARDLVQLSLFQQNVHDAIVSQFLPLVPNSPTLYSYLANVDRVRSRGVELTVGRDHLLVPGLEAQASVTYLDARTLALSGRASATAPAGSAVGKFLPNVPRWRGTVTTTYRPVPQLGVTLAGRYSSKLFTTLDNTDVNPNTWQGFGEWFVADARAHYDIDRRWSASVGVDNLLDRKYFLFHPFPQRTVVGSLRVGF